jgi:hypothetical protein
LGIDPTGGFQVCQILELGFDKEGEFLVDGQETGSASFIFLPSFLVCYPGFISGVRMHYGIVYLSLEGGGLPFFEWGDNLLSIINITESPLNPNCTIQNTNEVDDRMFYKPLMHAF